MPLPSAPAARAAAPPYDLCDHPSLYVRNLWLFRHHSTPRHAGIADPFHPAEFLLD